MTHQPSFNDLLTRGKEAAQAGKHRLARVMLRQALRLNPRSAEGWYWLAAVEPDAEKRRAYLEVALKLNPDHPDARRLLSQLPPAARKAKPQPGTRAAPQPRRRDRVMLIAWALVIVSGVATGVLTGLVLALRPDVLPLLFPPTPTLTSTPSTTFTPSPSPTPTRTPTITPSPTPTMTPTRTPSATPTPTATPPAVGRILYTSEKDGDFEVYMMDEMGAEQAKLTDNDADEFSPRFSPDGRRIAFVSDRDGDAEIFVMNVDGTNVVQLTHNDVADHSPAWSPDGKMLVYYSERDGNGELYLTSVSVDYTRRLTENDHADYYPAWWPGRRIVFTSNRGDDSASYQLYAMDETGSEVTQLTESGSVNWYADWSPECVDEAASCRLTWVSLDPASGTFQVLVMDASGYNVTQVTTARALHIYPVWSPDGRRVAFTSDRNGSQDIYTVAVDCPDDPADCEATMTRLTTDPAPELVSDWGLVPP